MQPPIKTSLDPGYSSHTISRPSPRSGSTFHYFSKSFPNSNQSLNMFTRGKGLGKGGAKPNRKVLRDNIVLLCAFALTNLTASALPPLESEGFQKDGNNGSRNCADYCAGEDWGLVGGCSWGYWENEKSRVSCSLTPGLIDDGSQLTCGCTAEPVKKGNNGSTSCEIFCRGPQYGRVGTCQSAFNQDSHEGLGCNDVPGLLPNNAELTCICRFEGVFAKPGNNGSTSCNRFCENVGGSFGPYGQCVSSQRQDTKEVLGCDAVPGYLGGETHMCWCK